MSINRDYQPHLDHGVKPLFNIHSRCIGYTRGPNVYSVDRRRFGFLYDQRGELYDGNTPYDTAYHIADVRGYYLGSMLYCGQLNNRFSSVECIF